MGIWIQSGHRADKWFNLDQAISISVKPARSSWCVEAEFAFLENIVIASFRTEHDARGYYDKLIAKVQAGN